MALGRMVAAFVLTITLAAMLTCCDAFSPSMSRFYPKQGKSGIVRRFSHLCMQQNQAEQYHKKDQGHLVPAIDRRDLVLMGCGIAASTLLSNNQQAAAEQAGASKGTVLVVGATGAIGQIACQDLLEQGFKVRGLTRKQEQVKELAKKIEWVSKVDWVGGDLKLPETLRASFQGVDKVIFAAGAHAYEEGRANNKRIFADSVGTLASLAKEAGVTRFVLVSSAGVTNLSAFQNSEYLFDVLKWKAKGEELLKASGVPYTIVRIYLYNEVPSEPSSIVFTQGDPMGSQGPISLANLAMIMSKSLTDPGAKNLTFEVFEGSKRMSNKSSWEEAFARLTPDTSA